MSFLLTQNLKERRIYPIDVIKGLVHTTQNFVWFAQNCLQEAISSANDYFQLPKFSQVSPNFKDAVKWIRTEAYSTTFCHLTKSFVPLTAFLLRVILYFTNVANLYKFCFKCKISLRKHPFLLALRRRGRFARRNVCDSATEIPYWWRNPMFT